MISCEFIDNWTILPGGEYGDCEFVDNWAISPGREYSDFEGFYSQGGAPTLTDCSFLTDGALSVGPVTMLDCSFMQSPLSGELAVVSGCVFDESYVNCEDENYTTATLTWCTLTGSERSAFTCCGNIAATLTNCTLAYNPGTGPWGTIDAWEDGTVLLENCIIAFNTRAAATCDDNASLVLSCCNLFGNAGGDWVGCIADQYGIDGNISMDPLFCGEEWNPLLPYLLDGNSPCAPDFNPECGLIGARPVGCGHPAGVSGQKSSPTTHILHQNQPNPFDQVTMLRYDLPVTTSVRLSIFSEAGRCVRTLIDAAQPAGTHLVRWFGTDASGIEVDAGVYFYRLTAGNRSETRRLLLIR